MLALKRFVSERRLQACTTQHDPRARLCGGCELQLQEIEIQEISHEIAATPRRNAIMRHKCDRPEASWGIFRRLKPVVSSTKVVSKMSLYLVMMSSNVCC